MRPRRIAAVVRAKRRVRPRSRLCRAEQIRALDKDNRVLPVLAVRVPTGRFIFTPINTDFTNDADYPARLGELLADIRGDATAALHEAYHKTRVTYGHFYDSPIVIALGMSL